MSPMQFSDKVLEKFPAFKCFLAGADPLRDDGYKFAYRLFKLGREVQIAEFKKLPHGFLNFDVFPFLAEESNQAVKQSSMWFKLEMTKRLPSYYSKEDSGDNYVLYKNKKLMNEREIVQEVESDIPLWMQAVNKLSLPFLKLFF